MNAPLGKHPLLAAPSCDALMAVHERPRLLAYVHTRLHRDRHKAERSTAYRTMYHILPEPRPLGLLSPRGCVQLCRRTRSQPLQQVRAAFAPPQRRPGVGIQSGPSNRPGICSDVPPPIGSSWQRGSGARRLPGYHGASGSSWVPPRRPSTDDLL